MKTDQQSGAGEADLSFANCGLVDRILARVGLMRTDSPRLVERAIFVALWTWLPLLILSLLFPPRDATVHPVFLRDLTAHVRLLLVAPLLVLAEGSIGARTRMVVTGLATSGVVAESSTPRLWTALRRARSLLDSTVTEVLLLALTGALALAAIRTLTSDSVLCWYEQATPAGQKLSPAGLWYAIAATPMVSFLFLRWSWRYLVWSWFLWAVSRLQLRLAGAHPDRTGGLGFVNIGQVSFAAIFFGVACVVSAVVANRTLNFGVPLKSFQSPLIAFVVIAVVVGVAPLLAFSPALMRVKRLGLVRYGELATQYVQAFERKWLRPNVSDDGALLGTSDIQSLADLGGSFERVDGLRPVLVDRRIAIAFAVAAAAPMVPLLLTVMPLRDVFRLLVSAMI